MIECNGTDLPPEFVGLPPGRCRLEAVAEEVVYELTEEQERGIAAARQSIREGRTLTVDDAAARM